MPLGSCGHKEGVKAKEHAFGKSFMLLAQKLADQSFLVSLMILRQL